MAFKFKAFACSRLPTQLCHTVVQKDMTKKSSDDIMYLLDFAKKVAKSPFLLKVFCLVENLSLQQYRVNITCLFVVFTKVERFRCTHTQY